MDPNLRYPLYVIASRDGVLVVRSQGQDCVLLFHSKELAARHIAETKTLGATIPLHPLAVPTAEAFREGLESLPPEITCAIWDATLRPGHFVHVAIGDLLQTLNSR